MPIMADAMPISAPAKTSLIKCIPRSTLAIQRKTAEVIRIAPTHQGRIKRVAVAIEKAE